MAGSTMQIDLVTADPILLRAMKAALKAPGFEPQVRARPSDLSTSPWRVKVPLIIDLGSSPQSLDAVTEALLRRRPTILTAASTTIEFVVEAMRQGAAYFLEQPICPDQLILACEACVVSDLQESSALLTSLSRRELEVLEGVCLGESSKVAARKLGISHRTVECHRARMRSKLGARTLPSLIGLVARAKGEGVSAPGLAA